MNDLVRVKYRVAGSLVSGPEIPKKKAQSLIDKIKSLANIQTGNLDLYLVENSNIV